jgi:hypothetical protein
MSRLKKDLITAAVIGIFAIVFFYGFSCLSIYTGIKHISAEASGAYDGDKVSALMALIDDEERELPERNRAVWALGQVGDARALPILEKHYTGEPCDHDRFLCQHELEKAIRKCRGSVNLTSWVNGFALKSRQQ